MKHFLKNQRAITHGGAAIVMTIIIVFAVFAYLTMPAWVPKSATNNNNSILGPSGTQAPTGDQSVNKPLKLVMTNIYGGGALTGTSSVVQVYQADGVTKSGSALTLSSSSCTTTLSYPSGTHLMVAYAYSTTDFMWWNVLVPTMSVADAQSLTTNTVSLQGFNSPTLTDSAIHSNGTSLTDGSVMNVTTNPTGSITYSWFVAAANTGFLSSHDPVYNIDNKAVVWATVSTGSYTTVTLSGWDGKISRGTTDYYYKVVDPTTLSLYKVGNNYVLPGTGAFTFGYTAPAYTGSTTVLQLYLYIYSDPSYMQSYGSYGPSASQLAEQTITLTV